MLDWVDLFSKHMLRLVSPDVTLLSFQMAVIFQITLLDEFVSIAVTRFRTLNRNERLELSGGSGMALDYRVVLKGMPTAAIQTTLHERFPSEVTFGSGLITSFRVGGR